MYCGSWVSSNYCVLLPSSIISRVNSNKPYLMRTSDIFISHPCFERNLTKTRVKLSNPITNKIIKIQTRFAICALATFESESLTSNSNKDNLNSDFEFEDEEEGDDLEERERRRRLRISKANRGNIPWNKGRKHSPETLQKIKERTRIAMQDPKVKLKLINLGHAQSTETKAKIGQKVREGWRKRREKLHIQEGCFFEWQNIVAELARLGFQDQDELQWDSYQLIQEKLEKEILENKEKRKLMPRRNGNKRAPKSDDQRLRIAEAIRAKWADPDYRERVKKGMVNHYAKNGISPKPKQPKKKIENNSSLSRSSHSEKKEITKKSELFKNEINANFIVPKKPKKSAPAYKDPMASSKLEMIKKIKNERDALEIKKRDATNRAKLLIAEAEKAAKALEIAALSNPLAQASLIESRNLISKAIKILNTIEEKPLTDFSNEISDQITPKYLHVNGNNGRGILVNGSTRENEEEIK